MLSNKIWSVSAVCEETEDYLNFSVRWGKSKTEMSTNSLVLTVYNFTYIYIDMAYILQMYQNMPEKYSHIICKGLSAWWRSELLFTVLPLCL